MSTNDNNKEYFDSYASLEVHKVMLEDAPRNEAYRKAISANESYINGKVILDVGAGTGILSVLFAKAGASKVYAVEASEIVSVTESIVKENQVEEVVKIIKGTVEDIQLPEKVDIIVSEWMGFYLLHEAMLDSVLTARDRFLKETGILFPDKCKLYAAPCTLPSFHSRWNDVSTVKMDSFACALRKLYDGKPEIAVISPQLLLSDEHCVLELSLADTTSEDLDELSCELFAVSKRDAKYQGVCIWFTTSFPSPDDANPVVLSTAPTEEPTHWKQTVLVLQDEVEVEEDEPIAGVFTFRRSDTNARFYNIEFAMADPETKAHPVPCDCYYSRCAIIKALSAKYDEQEETSE